MKGLLPAFFYFYFILLLLFYIYFFCFTYRTYYCLKENICMVHTVQPIFRKTYKFMGKDNFMKAWMDKAVLVFLLHFACGWWSMVSGLLALPACEWCNPILFIVAVFVWPMLP